MPFPKILVITVASWNSKVGSNTWTSLLRSRSAENIANLCIRDEIPDSPVCSRYFSISENKIIKSVLRRSVKTGREISANTYAEPTSDLMEHNSRYNQMRKKRRYSMLFARELIWKAGKWHTKELDDFLDDFKPDIILHSMEGYIHLNRITMYAIRRTGAKAIGYIWDDNFTYKQSKKIGYKFYRFFQRRSLKKLAKNTSDFFAISPYTKKEADAFLGIDCKILTKPLSRIPQEYEFRAKQPFRILYTGNLLIGRDRSLVRFVNALKKMPADFAVVDVYTQTNLSDEIMCRLDPAICTVHEPIPQNEALKKQKDADILLFLEDIDGPDALVARLSFSTKITDYLSAGKPIFAIGNLLTAPMQYFIAHDAAMVAGTEEEIFLQLSNIHRDPIVLQKITQNSCQIAKKNHAPEMIQKTFDTVIQSQFMNHENSSN